MKPKIFILTTGGTIAHRSRQDGPAVMDCHPEELVNQISLPDIQFEIKELIRTGSMNIVPVTWTVIAEAVAEVLMETAPQGLVILHGTDTIHYTASALSFMLRDLSVPLVLTGSMIPGGDPGSDSLPNLRDAIRVAAYSDIAEVCIVFSGDAERSKGLIIRGSRARKIHSVDINAFDSINVPPIGFIEGERISYTNLTRRKRTESNIIVSTDLDPNVALIKLNPATTAEMLAVYLQEMSGAVLEGTGVGHMRPGLQEVIESFDKPVVMSTQTIYGGECLGKYDVDQSILGIKNLIPARDMTSETALVKLMWALAQEDDVRSMMLTNLAGEISE
jgi:L-asparaginase type I